MSQVEYEKRAIGKKLGGLMSGGDLMLYAITGYESLITCSKEHLANAFSVGFFLDSYDLFIINLMSPIWQYE
jgi:hypothetical protein